MASTFSLQEARHLVLQAAERLLEPESVGLLDSLGRRLAKDFHADTPWPTTDRSAMDGFAVYAGASSLAKGRVLDVVGESLAGKPFEGKLAAGQAIRIMTGGVLPKGADAVVAVERTSGFDGPRVTVHEAVERGANVRRQGSEAAPGALLLQAGQRIRAAEIGVLAVLGIDPVPVVARPLVAILATGDEVVDMARVPAPHQVRNSNAHALAAQVRESGGESLLLGIAADRRDDLLARLRDGLARADVLLSIGGVSKGTHDLVHGVLHELGVREVFHGIALKPGKPTFFGIAAGDRQRFVFGLPGNPASCFTVFDLLVRPLLLRLMGALEQPAMHAVLGGARAHANARLQAVPARLAFDEDGRATALLAAPSPSGDPFSLVPADGYALLAENADPAAAAVVRFEPYAGGPA